jgi:AcrR family transcriptional regulator
MPHPARISETAIAEAARALLEEEGIEGLSMRELARRLGVQAPSLYFYVRSRDDLLRLLNSAGLRELGAMLTAAASGEATCGARLHAMADAYASFAFGAPQLFRLIFGPCPEERRAEASAAEAAARPLLEAAAELVAGEDVLDIAMALWSLVHGYTTLALSEQFQMGGEPRKAIHRALDYLLGAIESAGGGSSIVLAREVG